MTFERSLCFYFSSLSKHCLWSLFLSRFNLHNVLRVFHCCCYIFHLRERNAKQQQHTVLFLVHYILLLLLLLFIFLQTKLQSRFSFSCCCRTAAVAIALFTLRLLWVDVAVALTTPCGVHTYLWTYNTIQCDYIYTNSSFFFVCKIFCRHGDKNRSI